MEKRQLNVAESCDKNNTFSLTSTVNSLDLRRYSINGILSPEPETSLTESHSIHDSDGNSTSFVDRFIGKFLFYFLNCIYNLHVTLFG